MCFKVIATVLFALSLSPSAVWGQSFGSSLAAGPSEILIGEPINQYAPGTVNIYRAEGNTWRRAGGITAPDGHPLDRFGRSLSLEGNRLLVGATSMDDSTRGAAFIYENRGGTWQLVTRLSPAGVSAGDAYGRLVRLNGDAAYVVSWGANQGRGVISPWRRGVTGQWSEEPAISASDGTPGSFFGSSISIEANRLVVGAAQRDTSRGQVYIFDRERAGGAWVEQAHFRPADLPAGASFGSAVLLQGENLLVAAPGVDSARGAIYVYARDGAGQWIMRDKVAPADLTTGAQFGAPLQLVGSELWAGAQGANRNTGTVYRLTRGSGGRWIVAGKIELPSGEPGDFFGGTFAVSGNHGVVGLPNDDFGAGTAAFVSRRQGSWTVVGQKVWTEAQSLAAMTGNKVTCSEGRVGVFECQDVSVLSYLPVKDIGGGRGVRLNDVWGWTDPTTNREYALVGRIDGTSFVDVTDPVNPRYLGDLPKTDSSPASTWRDIKVYRDHAYIVADGAQAHGMQVFDLTRLRQTSNTPVTFRPDTTYHRIYSAHNIVIDTISGFAFTVGNSSGGETCGGALHMIDIREPTVPKFAGCFGDPQTGIQHTGYTHDAQCLVYQGPDSAYRGRQICVNSSETAIGVADVTDKSNPKAISRASYPNVGYTHQGWFSENQRYFYVNDEGDEVSGTVQGTRTMIWDMTDLDDPVIAAQYISDNKSSDHNLYIKGNLMYQSNYSSGLRIMDISDPVKPRLVAHLDTTPTGEEDTPGFDGSWSNYPYFKSGTILVTSIAEGLFMVQGPVRPAIP